MDTTSILLSLLKGGLASAIGWSIWYLVQLIQQGQRQKPKVSKANPLLAKQLLRLVGGDTNTARRLLRNINSRNPGRSVDWCLEKAIHDLERDRR
jgi:hypothetical protein